MAFSLPAFGGRRDDDADIARRLAAANAENLTMRTQLALAVQLVDALSSMVSRLIAQARERESFVAQVSRYIEASVPPLHDDGSGL